MAMAIRWPYDDKGNQSRSPAWHGEVPVTLETDNLTESLLEAARDVSALSDELIISAIESPNWTGRYADWEPNVPAGIKSIWENLTRREKLAVFSTARLCYSNSRH